MKLITAYNKQMKPYYENLKRSCDKYGYDLYSEQINIERSDYTGKQKSNTFKPEFVLKCMQKFGEVLWLDSDCQIMSKLKDFPKSDMTVTTRRNQNLNNMFSGYLNSGVVFCRDINLIYKWIELTKRHGKDQTALHHLVLDKKRNILEVPCRIWNYIYLPDVPKEAKIIHYKGETRKYFKDYCIL